MSEKSSINLNGLITRLIINSPQAKHVGMDPAMAEMVRKVIKSLGVCTVSFLRGPITLAAVSLSRLSVDVSGCSSADC